MIKAEKLTFSYTNTQPFLFENLDLVIQDGEYVSVMGENGSGKSTLIRLMLRLLKPTKGRIQCDTRRIGYVPQKGDVQNAQFPITVYEMLNAYRKLLHLHDKNTVMESLARVHMEDFRNSLAGTLSGGQYQKILIARALMGNPALLILDEPSTGVDIGSQKEIYSFLNGLNRQNGITIVSVEHNLEAAVANSTLIYHLSEGKGHLCSPEKYVHEFLKNGGEEEHA